MSPVTASFVWGCAVGVLPLAVSVGVLCAMVRMRPATRHALWVVVLLALVTPIGLRAAGVPQLGTLIRSGLGADAPDSVGGIGTTGSRNGEATDRGQSARIESGATAEPVTAAGARRGANPIARGRAPGVIELGVSPEPASLGLPGGLADLGAFEIGTVGGEGGPDRAWPATSTDRTPADASVLGGTPTESASDRPFAAMLNAARALREVFRSVPALPQSVWLGGISIVAFVTAWRLSRVRRALRRASPANAQDRSLVREVARDLGLRRVPEAVMTDLRVCPMVACWATPRLVLPNRLWSDMDEASRRAVIAHELAHLRRRDHWVWWLATLIGVAYWWHPVVWWARRRLQDEADLSCDAWVIATLPRHRRAYAEALVQTRAFISDGSARAPTLGLGMTPARARRFARRLTMVMTRTIGPKASVFGAALALTTLAAGSLLTPAVACPPEESAARAPRVISVSGTAPGAVALDPDGGVAGLTLAAPAPLATAGLAAPAAPTWLQPEAPDSMRRLEDRLARLEARIDRLLADGPGANAPARPSAPGAVIAPRSAGGGAAGVTAPQDAGEQMQQAYKLPEGKLDAFWELMAREDVPVFVSRQEGAIVVHGSAEQQRIVCAFLNLIAPDSVDSPAGGAYSQAIGEYEQALRARAAEAAAVDALRQAGAQRDGARAAQVQAELAPRLTTERGEAGRAARLEAEVAVRRAMAQQDQVRRTLEVQALALRSQVERSARQAEAVRERAQSVRGAERRELQDQAQALEAQSEQIRARLEEIQARIEQMAERSGSAQSDDCDEACEEDCCGCEGECEACCEAPEEEADEVEKE